MPCFARHLIQLTPPLNSNPGSAPDYGLLDKSVLHFINNIIILKFKIWYIVGQGLPGRQRKLSQKDSQHHRIHHKPRPSSADDQSLLKQDLTRSPRSDGGSRKTDRRARYWKFLFDNLQRAVDAIYETCEQDESVVECKVCI